MDRGAGGLLTKGSQRAEHNWSDWANVLRDTFMPQFYKDVPYFLIELKKIFAFNLYELFSSIGWGRETIIYFSTLVIYIY